MPGFEVELKVCSKGTKTGDKGVREKGGSGKIGGQGESGVRKDRGQWR